MEDVQLGRIATIGYEGAVVEDFIATLVSAGIQTLLDVREIAASRRQGFSKTALSEALGNAGINYIHLKGLGDPKPGRDAAKAGRMDDFKRIFLAHLATEGAQADLSAAASIIQQQPTCLLCFERNPQNCHRSLVANALSDILTLEVQHLGVQQGRARNACGGSRRSVDTRQGASANG